MKNIVLFFALSVICIFTIDTFAQGNKPPKAAPVTTTVEDADSSGVPFRLQSDLFSTLSNPLGWYRGGVDSVITEIQTIGDWVLDLNSSATRKVYLSFEDPVPAAESGQTPNPPFQTAMVTARIISKCAENAVFLPNLTVGSSPALCPLSIAFSYGGSSYGLRMNTNNFSDTEFAQWVCLAQSGSTGKCVSWQMEPGVVQANGERKIKGQLIRLASGKKDTDQPRGLFYISFRVNVTNP